MWYLAGIILASKMPLENGDYPCEECNVLFQGESPRIAYEKALAWGSEAVSGDWHLLGVKYLTTVGDEIGEGVDICGRVMCEFDVWSRKDKFIPPFDELAAVKSLRTMDIPISEILGGNAPEPPTP
jgi:hypothetical protein